ncbi:tetratricopeptide repeat protein [Pendulispora albinea]|uniref:Tetratricopeptide repeat protein n=1 Tax=Pendulispora albinea TaxID=2741071 RepID=A0ABZ2LWY2_9BACT
MAIPALERGDARASGRWGSRALVAATAALAHASALGGGWIWLDHAHIGERYAIAEPTGWLGLFTRGFAGTGYYRPLMALALSIDALVGRAWFYHAVNVAWHAVASVLVAAVAEGLVKSAHARRAAWLGGSLFAVHPLASLVASGIAFRSEAMMAVALLGLCLAHREGKAVLAGGLLFAGALIKETALVLGPLYVLAFELTAPRRGARGESAARRRLLAWEAGALACAVGLRLAYAPPWRALHAEMPLGAALGTRFGLVGKSVLALVFPLNRSICDAFPVLSLSSARSLAGVVLVAGIGVLAFYRRGPALLFALSLLPSLNLAPLSRWWSPHYLYLPLAFAAMLAAEGVFRVWPRATARSLAAVAPTGTVAVVACLGLLTARDDRRFASDETLWSREVAACDACLEGHFYLGEVRRAAGRWEQAAKHYEAALRPRPGWLAYVDRGAALQNLGTVRLELGHLDASAAAFREALTEARDERTQRTLRHDLATVAMRSGDAAEAVRLLEPELARADAFPESVFLCAKALHTLGRDDASRVLLARLRNVARADAPTNTTQATVPTD